MFLLIFIGVASVLAFVVLLDLTKNKWEKSPPGPPGIPVFGNMFQVDKFQHVTFNKWAKKYGPIFKLRFLKSRQIVISDHKMVKEIFSQSAFSGRPETPFVDILLDGKRRGIVSTDGAHWEELRHFTLRQLRDFGFGKNSMEESIMIEVNDLIQTLADVGNSPVTNIKERLLLAVVNALWFIATGSRYKQDDAKVLKLSEKVDTVVAGVVEKRGYMFLVPGLPEFFPKFSGFSKIQQVFREFAAVFQEQVDGHVKTYSENYVRDFSEAFLKEAYATTSPQSAFYGKLGVENLTSVLSDLYFAGSDTTSSTLSWMMIYLTQHPEVQQKLQAEIELVTGNTRPCALSDRSNMPYTEAVIAETLRYSSIVPVSLPHRVMSDTQYKGYNFPKGAIIFPNLYFIHFDPEVWGDPENFRPERFLSKDGKTFQKHEALMPFSYGRRQCLGESLARANLFLFTTNIFQRFAVEFDHTGPNNGLDSELRLILAPKPFHLILKDRQK